MAPWHGRFSAESGWRVIAGLGALYIGLAVAYPFIPGNGTVTHRVHFVAALLVGGPGVVLLYGGYRIPHTDIRHEFYPTIARWCVGGIMTTLGLLLFTALVATARDLVSNVLILTAFGGMSGAIAGAYDAQAKTRERDLEETIERLRTSNDRLEQFAYATSHDLQEPLRMVSSFLQLLEKRYGDVLDEDGQEYVTSAVTGADRMRTTVASLFEYSQATNEWESVEQTNVEDVLNGVLDTLRIPIDETEATITSDELLTVQGDADQLALVFQNLLSNAVIHSGEEPPRIHVGVERREEAWQFSVADNGIGIEPKHHDRIFEMFQQLHRDETVETNSVGIGLALCERIIEGHGGELWVDSEPGEGATFYFTHPVPQARS